MRIECKLLRSNGTQVTLGETTYDFQPGADGRHVAEVTHKVHLASFLGIPEAYEVYDPSATPDTRTAETDEDDVETDAEQASRYENMTLEELQAEYTSRVGKPAHPQTKHETLVKKLFALDAEKA